MKFTKLLLVAVCLFTLFQARAEDDERLSVRTEVRVDYMREYDKNRFVDEGSGFFGSYVNIMLDGKFANNFSFHYKQGLNKTILSDDFFDAAEWLYLSYARNNWSVSAGKLVVAIGGFEYDAATIDMYSCTEFWHNIPCYQLGVSADYTTDKGNDMLQLQITQSPFNSDLERDLYGYSAIWYGNHGVFNTIYSANLFEYTKGSYISYISLGNELDFGNLKLQCDFMNRADNHQTFLFDDVSITGNISYLIADRVNVFAKGTYDVNKSGRDSDFTVFNGTEVSMVGAGIEYFPIKNSQDLRIHANYFHAFGNNTNIDGTQYDNRRLFNVGLTWKVDLFKLAAK